MKNVSELRDELSEVFTKLKAGTMDNKRAKELANIAGKMIGSAKVQVEYYAVRKDNKEIPFLK